VREAQDEAEMMHLAVHAGTVTAHDKDALKRWQTERARERARRDPPRRSGDWVQELAAMFPGNVETRPS